MQHRLSRLTPAAAAAALILTACGDGAGEGETANANLAATTGEIAAIDRADAAIVYPIGTEASLETNALRPEVERLQREQGGTQAAGQTNAQAAGQTGGQTAAQAGGGAGAAMNFAGLDRDADSRLSPAEYAIYSLPGETPARQGATNDENPPFVSDEALNEAASSFRRLDANGDFFLSSDEFEAGAR